MATVLTVLAFTAGLGAVIGGIGWIYPPAGLIVGGLGLTGIAVAVRRGSRA